MTINARKQGTWRRGLTAMAAAGALLLSGTALAPTVAAGEIKVSHSFKIESANGERKQEKCDNRAGTDAHPFLPGEYKPDGWVGETPHEWSDGEPTGVLTCNGYYMQETEPTPPAPLQCTWEQLFLLEWEMSCGPGTEDEMDTLCAEAKNRIPEGYTFRESIPFPNGANSHCSALALVDEDTEVITDSDPVQDFSPPPPCWSAEGGNNCPVGGALRFAAPTYAVVGVPVTMFAYASWRPDENSLGAPTNGSAVIRVDGEDYSGVEFVDGIAQWRFIPQTAGTKTFTASGVVFSGTGGGSAYIDTVPATVEVLPYDRSTSIKALNNVRVEVGDKYTIVDKKEAKTALGKRLEWSVSPKSEDVCAVYETKRGKVKAKFTDSGKCTVIWADPKSAEEGKYTFIAKK